MSENNRRIKDTIFVLISCVFVGLGVSMIIRYDFGADPLSLFEVGISISSGLSIGTVSLIYSIIIFIISIIINKKKVGLGTIVYAISIGPFIDIFLSVLPDVQAIALFLFLLGHIFLCGGVAALIYLDRGYASLDVVIDFTARKLSVRYRTIKILSDVIFTVFGTIFGASLNWGTLYLVLTSGYYIEFFTKWFRKF